VLNQAVPFRRNSSSGSRDVISTLHFNNAHPHSHYNCVVGLGWGRLQDKKTIKKFNIFYNLEYIHRKAIPALFAAFQYKNDKALRPSWVKLHIGVEGQSWCISQLLCSLYLCAVMKGGRFTALSVSQTVQHGSMMNRKGFRRKLSWPELLFRRCPGGPEENHENPLAESVIFKRCAARDG
jgi:hypothetical protein